MSKPWSPQYQPFPGRIIRATLLAHPVCQKCGVERATEVDHRVNVATCRRIGIDPSVAGNAQALCAACHAAKTRAEITAGKARLRPRRVYRHPSEA
jgi:5-methylcytosine-specific restriction endonuclease McrA